MPERKLPLVISLVFNTSTMYASKKIITDELTIIRKRVRYDQCYYNIGYDRHIETSLISICRGSRVSRPEWRGQPSPPPHGAANSPINQRRLPQAIDDSAGRIIGRQRRPLVLLQIRNGATDPVDDSVFGPKRRRFRSRRKAEEKEELLRQIKKARG